jgi:hypothetical protein
VVVLAAGEQAAEGEREGQGHVSRVLRHGRKTAGIGGG